MLNGCKSAQERWGGVHKLIDNWLSARQDLIVRFYSITTCNPFAEDFLLGKNIQKLCQQLMDYCSTGHFEIYEQLLREAADFDDGGLELAHALVPRLDGLTIEFVDFNDLYAETCNLNALAHLPKNISTLGEALAERFELEDQLIEKLHNIHKELIVN